MIKTNKITDKCLIDSSIRKNKKVFISVPKSLVLDLKDDKIGFDALILSFRIKHMFVSSTVVFDSKEDLCRKLSIGRDSLNEIISSKFFDNLFIMKNNTLTARKYDINGIQIFYYTDDKDKPSDFYSIKINSCDSSMSKKEAKEFLYLGLFLDYFVYQYNLNNKDRGIVCYTSHKHLSDLYNIPVSYVRNIISLGLKRKLFKKTENRDFIIKSDDPERTIKEIVADNHFIEGFLFNKGTSVMVQYPNSYKPSGAGKELKTYNRKKYTIKKEISKEAIERYRRIDMDNMERMINSEKARILGVQNFLEKTKYFINTVEEHENDFICSLIEEYMNLKSIYGNGLKNTIRSIRNLLEVEKHKKTNIGKRVYFSQAKYIYIRRFKDKKGIAAKLTDGILAISVVEERLRLDKEYSSSTLEEYYKKRKQYSQVEKMIAHNDIRKPEKLFSPFCENDLDKDNKFSDQYKRLSEDLNKLFDDMPDYPGELDSEFSGAYSTEELASLADDGVSSYDVAGMDNESGLVYRCNNSDTPVASGCPGENTLTFACEHLLNSSVEYSPLKSKATKSSDNDNIFSKTDSTYPSFMILKNKQVIEIKENTNDQNGVNSFQNSNNIIPKDNYVHSRKNVD